MLSTFLSFQSRETVHVEHVCTPLLLNCRASLVAQFSCQCRRPEDAGSIPGSGRSLENEIVTHSSILAWETPWTEELGGV